jgi:hypothetical protein
LTGTLFFNKHYSLVLFRLLSFRLALLVTKSTEKQDILNEGFLKNGFYIPGKLLILFRLTASGRSRLQGETVFIKTGLEKSEIFLGGGGAED